MRDISDDEMRAMMATGRSYSLVILHKTPRRAGPGAEEIVWEHGRRNFALRAERLLPIVCPVSDDSDVSGIGIFDATLDEVKAIMDEDPGVVAGIFTYEAHACRSIPGDSLPE